MRVGLLVPSIGKNFGQKGFYNAQEIGLAKAMDSLFDEVIVYRLVSEKEEKTTERPEGCEHTTVHFLPAKSFGNNGFVDTDLLDSTIDALICFSDTQFAVPKIYRWAKKHDVQFFSYIGVTESHSTNGIIRRLVNGMFRRNVKVYRACECFVKTPAVQKELEARGVTKITVTPVGLDTSLAKKDYENYEPEELKQEFGYTPSDKVLLFVGRLTAEKRPLELLDIFSRIQERNPEYRLLMVGNGELRDEVWNAVQRKELSEKVQMIEKLPNREMWKLYRFSEAFLNLNRQEIFGMAILEAMYYGCKVVAYHAPGPDFIIEHGISGYLAENEDETIHCVVNEPPVSDGAHQRIEEHFTWDNMANAVKEKLENSEG